MIPFLNKIFRNKIYKTLQIMRDAVTLSILDNNYCFMSINIPVSLCGGFE
jgi:hypothetical protein